MAPRDPIDDLDDPDANYHESSDEDFNPTQLPADESSSSDDEETAPAKPARGRGKRKAADDELDSGDEVTIEQARKRKAKRRKGAKDDAEDDELLLSDEGADGGLVKTRAQRKVEYVISSSVFEWYQP